MEHWNDVTFTLNQILEERYLNMLVKKRAIPEMILKGKTVKEKINNALEYEDISMDCGDEIIEEIDLDNYIRYRKKIIYKMLDIILGDSKSKLSDNKGRAILNLDNYIFVNALLDFYEEKNENYKYFIEKRFNDLDNEFIEIINIGFIELAKNKNNDLQVEDVVRKLNFIFNSEYKKIEDMMEDLRANIKYYVAGIPQTDENKEVFNAIKNILFVCNEEIVNLAKDKMEFPDLDFEELEKEMKINAQNKKLRRDRAKAGWKNRRENK